MDKHILTEIEIKDFKCFKDFKADGFKRVNLIGGKNNVGKTAFMEACFVNVSAKNIKKFLSGLESIKFMRENLNILEGYSTDTKELIEQSNNIFVKSNINLASFNIEDIKGIKQYIFEFNKQHIKVNINDFSFETNSVDNIRFIDNFGLSNNNIINNYSAIQKKEEELFLNDTLNKFDKRITVFKVIEEIPQCKIDDEYLEITEFGDGVRHLVSIVTALYKCEGGYLFIDEIDNGIHYTQLDEIWTIILEVSKRLNVQVFATTHSKECINSYARVSKKLSDKDMCFVELGKDRDSNIQVVSMDYERFQDEIEMNNEVRGW